MKTRNKKTKVKCLRTNRSFSAKAWLKKSWPVTIMRDQFNGAFVPELRSDRSGRAWFLAWPLECDQIDGAVLHGNEKAAKAFWDGKDLLYGFGATPDEAFWSLTIAVSLAGHVHISDGL
jgi:hypothetical protein